MRVFLFLVLLVAAVAAQTTFAWYPLVDGLGAVDGLRAMPAITKQGSGGAPVDFPATVVVAREFSVPVGLECYNLAIDLPLARRWPLSGTAPTTPGAAHFTIWQVGSLPAVTWQLAASAAYDSWSGSMPSNRTWDPLRPLGTYRFLHRPTSALSGGVYREAHYYLGVTFDLVNASATTNWLGWAGTAPAAATGVPFVYWDVNGNYLADAATAAVQAVTTLAPAATAYYAGAALTEVALGLYANCTAVGFTTAAVNASASADLAPPNLTVAAAAATAPPVSPPSPPLVPSPPPSPSAPVSVPVPSPVPAPAPVPSPSEVAVPSPLPAPDAPSPASVSAPEAPSPAVDVVPLDATPAQLEIKGFFIGAVVLAAVGLVALAAALLFLWRVRRQRQQRSWAALQRETRDHFRDNDGAPSFSSDEEEDDEEAVMLDEGPATVHIAATAIAVPATAAVVPEVTTTTS